MNYYNAPLAIFVNHALEILLLREYKY